MEIIVYEMAYRGKAPVSELPCIPFREEYWNEYMKIYNECFHEMREALEIYPADFYSDYSQMRDRGGDTFLYLHGGVIAGAVSCYGNELDDLIVNKRFRRQGLGKKLLLRGIEHIMSQGHNEAVLHAAQWNKGAVGLYLKTGFTVVRTERIR